MEEQTVKRCCLLLCDSLFYTLPQLQTNANPPSAALQKLKGMAAHLAADATTLYRLCKNTKPSVSILLRSDSADHIHRYLEEGARSRGQTNLNNSNTTNSANQNKNNVLYSLDIIVECAFCVLAILFYQQNAFFEKILSYYQSVNPNAPFRLQFHNQNTINALKMKKKDLQNFFSRCKKLVEQNISTNTKGKTAKSASVESPLLLLTLVYFYFHQNKNNLPSAEQKRLFHLLQTDIRSGLASLKEEEKNENNQQKEEDKLALKYIKQFIFHPEGSTTTLKRKRARPGEEAEEGYAVRSFHGRAAPQEEEESEEDSFNFEEEINELFASSGQAVRSILDRRQTPLYGEVVDPLWEREGDHGRARPPLSLLQLTVDAMEHKVNRYWDALQQHLLDPCLFFENPLDHRFLFNDALVCIPRHVVNSFVLSRRLLVFALWSSYDGQHGGALLSDRLALYASRVLSPQDEEHGECPVCSHMHPRLEGDSTSEGGDSDTHHVKNKSTHDATEGDDTKQLLRRTMTERVSTRREAAGHTGWFAIDGIRRHEKADTTEGRQTDPLVLLLHRLHALAELLVYCGNRSKRHLRQLDGQLGESGSVPLDPFQYFSNMIALDSDRNTPSQFTWVLADTGITPSTLMSRTLECLVTDILLRDTADGERPPVPFRSQVEYVFSKKNNPETATESPHTPVSLSTTVNRVSLLTSQPNTLYTEGYTQDTSNHSTSHLLLECVQCFRTFHQSCLLPSQREESLYTQVNTNLPTSLTAEDTSAEHDSPPQCLSGFRCHQCRLTPCTAPMEDTPYILPPLAIQTTETAS